ncbi:MAG: 16S rRNA (uracil(1498)-N(3))-methyltransferase [Gammaproteobacteria bacterium]|nr:16S rRNA (uracil(1498)-N(3))-methyltransferase [Gammaproteobacteria bacterium]
MRTIRIHHPEPLSDGQELALSEEAAGHVARVLRLSVGDELTLFCGDNREYPASIVEVGKRTVRVHLGAGSVVDRESPLGVSLVQAVSRGEKMDYTIQKATELGVAAIQPVFTERCGVRLADERLDKRIEHWQKVAISACEQCGRNRVPELLAPVDLKAWLAQAREGQMLTLDPLAEHSLSTLPHPTGPLSLVIGPEGGLSEAEIAALAAAGARGLRLGPRILRTETAGLAVLAGLNARFGDF